MKRNSILLLLTLCATLTLAQSLSPEQTGGVYYAYPVTSSQKIHFPDGFDVFYISHYGRHGSRWLPDDSRYEWVNAQFSDDENLTEFGKTVKKRLKKVWKNARGNGGQLTQLGKRQHEGIARRMAEHYPEVFQGDDTRISAQSSTVTRCRTSMLAFCDELQRCFRQLHINPVTDAAHMAYINNESDELKAFTQSVRRLPNISTDRLISALFIDKNKVKEPKKLLSELHTIASDMQDIPLRVDLWDCFTKEEMMAVHDANNERMTLCNGLTPLNHGIPARSAMSLWQNIVTSADEIINNHAHGATLRFGHDTALYRLLTLLQLSLPGTSMSAFLPMAANLQMIFARNADGRVLVQFLLNEKTQKLPILSAVGNTDCCYDWNDVKAYMEQRMHDLEHLRQLSSLNTMVGTASANTRTAGMFGKGSEEHGQTLPAVLVPNGQTFWTPQTRETERKCVAPYYYTDSIFQGIRASHWLVGGCTQDYGSFTVAAYGGKRKQGTPFSHDMEQSHPYYYSLYMPEENLRMELTALSHTAILRITPTVDQPVCSTITSNSDEQQGTVRWLKDREMVYGTNPVHRIYQGWGEPAGFSGHFGVVPMRKDFAAVDSISAQELCITFEGKAGEPIELGLVTSFTGLDGVCENYRLEMLSFDEMAEKNIGKWTARFHRIDIADTDTDRINQFYGALYRASFLPREMSDADGTRIAFAGKTGTSGLSGSSGTSVTSRPTVSFGDFSMWDTYRALHPLLTIIEPELQGQMMQSLVTMYEEGGWLPIFPCWNSYTAAMIGDHCAATLADSYVKGIRNFDAEKAYEGMRQNAMESPKNREEYVNGMGRRALPSYIKYGYIPLEDSVKEAFHTDEQTSRTLEYAFDDYCVAQMARLLGHDDDYRQLMARSENWRNVINPVTGWADGRHADGRWEGNTDLVHRKPYITEGATCHYTWYVPQNIDGLIDVMGGKTAFSSRLDSMFTERRYWHGNEPCHQVAWLFALAGQPEKTRHWVKHIVETEYNDTAGGLSGNDDAGQMSAWQVFACMGFYPVCPGSTQYVLGAPLFREVTLNLPSGRSFTMKRGKNTDNRTTIDHSEIVAGGTITFGE